MIVIERDKYQDELSFDRAVAALSRDMPSARMANGMAFFRDEDECKKCRALDSVVRGDGFYIDYGDENDIENTEG